MFRGFKAWLRKRREHGEALRLVAELFRSPERLVGTSLRRAHAGRWVYLDHEVDGDRVIRVRFGILRHPRPYAFSPQSHKVIETYVYHALDDRIERLRGFNVTRHRGRDAD